MLGKLARGMVLFFLVLMIAAYALSAGRGTSTQPDSERIVGRLIA